MKPDQCEGLDLSTWSVAVNGAEPIREETLQEFDRSFRPYGFRRSAFCGAYGLAEATLVVTASPRNVEPVFYTVSGEALCGNRVEAVVCGEPDAHSLAGCGRVDGSHCVVIVDAESLSECLPDQVGEVWVRSPSVALGYWNHPIETDQTFRATLGGHAGQFLRTGDMGFLREGELFITGRLKDLVVIRGRNHYPQDIELTVERSHPALRPGFGAAFSVGGGSEERLVVVQEIERSFTKSDIAEIIRDIRQAVSEIHDLEVYSVVLVRTGSIPKTSSGKIQRRRCRAAFLSGLDLKVVTEWRQPESELFKVAERPSETPQPSFTQIRNWLIARIGAKSGISPALIDPNSPFTSYGLDSHTAVMLSGELQDWLRCALPVTLLYDFPTIELVAHRLARESAPLSGREAQVAIDGKREAIAIIGMSCRLPGAKDVGSFWTLLRDGIDAVTEVPPDRWDIDSFYDPDPARPGKMSTRWGGFLEEVDQFDSHFFNISPREAIDIDPQQRLMLELAWNAFESAGLRSDQLAGSQTGVFVGICGNDYSRYQRSDIANLDLYFGTGNALSIAANRVSYQFDLRGPSVAVDTACSSSLVAVHLACQSLRDGECQLAVAGGVNLILGPETTIAFSKGRMMASDGRCKTFDARADGYVRGEGCGVIVLKRLSDAISGGDRILAIVRGSAVNQDGRSNGLTAPNGLAQQAVIRTALENAAVSGSEIAYVEAHGTGTPLGDPIEIDAVAQVLASSNDRLRPCAIGSVKTNIGHLEAAAGIAGLIKVVLSLGHRQIPPHLNLNKLNPYIHVDDNAIVIPTKLTPWSAEGERRLAGVSSFGFGGTNAHVVVEESAPGTTEETTRAGMRPGILVLSARSTKALETLAESYTEFLRTQAGSLRDVCYSAGVRRTHFEHRLSVSGYESQDLVEQCKAYLGGQARSGMASGSVSHGRNYKVVYVFPGQGSQWVGMAQQLFEAEAVFRETIEECDRAMKQFVHWSLVEELFRQGDANRLERIDVVQPILFAVAAGLSALWSSWGVLPEAVVGHSMGEIAAAYVAGALTIKDAAMIVCKRSGLLRRMSGQGSMAVIDLGLNEARQAINGMEDRISVAVSNSTKSTVLSGETIALQEVIEKLEADNVFCRFVKVNVASHSPQMDGLLGELSESLKEVQPRRGKVPIYSTVTGETSDGSDLNAMYWAANLRSPVLFSGAMQS
ncbi:MAG: beta-ketoacyl synthase N-terminal-like domain-containing protein, partial [Blastocatellia bacterium]